MGACCSSNKVMNDAEWETTAGIYRLVLDDIELSKKIENMAVNATLLEMEKLERDVIAINERAKQLMKAVCNLRSQGTKLSKVNMVTNVMDHCVVNRSAVSLVRSVGRWSR
jgi:CRISPR/Cas system-associated protein Cas7 (RAMP superfamily)